MRKTFSREYRSSGGLGSTARGRIFPAIEIVQAARMPMPREWPPSGTTWASVVGRA